MLVKHSCPWQQQSLKKKATFRINVTVKVIDFVAIWKEFKSLVCMPNMKSLSKGIAKVKVFATDKHNSRCRPNSILGAEKCRIKRCSYVCEILTLWCQQSFRKLFLAPGHFPRCYLKGLQKWSNCKCLIFKCYCQG